MALGEGGFSLSPGTFSTPPPRRARIAAPLAIADNEEQLAVADIDRNLELTPEAVEHPMPIVRRTSMSEDAESLLSPAGLVAASAIVPVDDVADQTAAFIKNRKEKMQH